MSDISDDYANNNTQSETLLKEESINILCKNIKTCESLKRLIRCLHFYETVIKKNNENNDDLFLKYMNEYSMLFNDYGHILTIHLNTGSQKKNDDNFLIINNKCIKYINCSLNKCINYSRNNRDRCSEELGNNVDNLLLIYTDILDTIHCYFLHSYHTGFRIKNKQKIYNKDNDNDDDNIDDNDIEMIYLSKEIKSKRKELELIRGTRRVKKNKFVIGTNTFFFTFFFFFFYVCICI